jgi:MFS family permease
MTTKPTVLSVLRQRDFGLFILSSLLSALAAEALTIAIAWKIYDISGDPVDLGLVGLMQFLPSCLLVFLTGSVADSFSRKRIVAICLGVEFLFVLAIFLVADKDTTQVWPILLLIAGLSAGRAFLWPAADALAPTLVKREEIASALAVSTSTHQLTIVAGPALGGLLYGISPGFAYTSALVMVSIAAVAILGMRHREQHRMQEQRMLDALVGGVKYVLQEKVVLGATTLDLFAVLLGSTAMLLPIFARDILVAGPTGLGLLRAATGIGALAVALLLGFWPIRRRAGHIMFAAVAVFGLGTVVFGLSRSLTASVIALIIMGAADMISVYIRGVLIQLWTPDHLRGRVNAVNGVIINASNELGGFRAGMVAASLGAVPAAVLGGICTLLVTGLWCLWFPKLRQANDLTDVDVIPEGTVPAITPTAAPER